MLIRAAHVFTLKWLFVAFLAGWALGLLYLFWGNDNVRFYAHLIGIQDKWAAHFSPSTTPRLIITGGSSCDFSIDAERLTTQSGVPVINAGLEAGLGLSGILLYASRLTQPGDTFIFAAEPDSLSEPPGFPLEALRLFIFRHEWDLVKQSREITGEAVPLSSLIFAARPGLDGFAASVGRFITRTPYRYDSARVNASGFMVTSFRFPLDSSEHALRLTPENRALLVHFRDWAAKKQVHMIYSLPWRYAASDQLIVQRRLNAQFLITLSEIMPVLHDEALGAQSEPDMFSDTTWHLNEQAAEARSQMILQEVQGHRFWTHNELLAASGSL